MPQTPRTRADARAGRSKRRSGRRRMSWPKRVGLTFLGLVLLGLGVLFVAAIVFTLLGVVTPGATVPAMLAIRDVMRLIPAQVSTLALGLACSAGQFLLSSGTPGKRFALPHPEGGAHEVLLFGSGILGGAILAQPFAGQVGFRLNRVKTTIDFWIPFAAGPLAPVAALQDEARKIQAANCCYALASQVQKLAEITDPLIDVSIPAAIFWGLSDKSHVATDRKSVQKYAPDASYTEWSDIGHFADIEAPEKIAALAFDLLG